MLKTIKIKDNTFNLDATGGTLCIYKQQFNSEYYDDFLSLKDIENKEDSTKKTLEVGFRLVWSMAKTAEPTLPDPSSWLESFEEFPLLDLMKVSMELLGKSFQSVINSSDGSGERLTSENLVACCLSCGMSMNDINSLSIGFLLNSISEYIKIQTGDKGNGQKKARKATQEDFDAF